MCVAPESALRCLQEERDVTRDVVVVVEAAAVARDATKAVEEEKDVTGLNTAHYLTSLTRKSFFYFPLKLELKLLRTSFISRLRDYLLLVDSKLRKSLTP